MPDKNEEPLSKKAADYIISKQRPNDPRKKSTEGMGGGPQSIGPAKASKTTASKATPGADEEPLSKKVADYIISKQRPNAPRKDTGGMGGKPQSIGPTKGSETPGFTPMPDASERLKQNAEKKRLDEEYRAKRKASEPPVQFAREVPKWAEEERKKSREKGKK